MLFSPWPSSASSAGRQRVICRHSSRPIDPPAPVTKIRLPASVRPTASSSIVARSGPRRAPDCALPPQQLGDPGHGGKRAPSLPAGFGPPPHRRTGGGRDGDDDLV